MVICFGFLLIATMFMVWFERKVIAGMQNRVGPNKAGPFGVLQTLADGIKAFFKEPILPERADRIVYRLAPFLAFVPAFLIFAVVPVGGDFTDGNDGVVSIFGYDTYLQVADPPVGILFVLAMSSIAVYGIMLAGWSSGSKYPLLGSVRASAQMVSYEAALGLSVATVLLVAGTLSTNGIVVAQETMRDWNIVATGVLPFVVFVIAATAELNRPPFDLVEAEQELVGGFNTEYSVHRLRLVLPGRVHEHGDACRPSSSRCSWAVPQPLFGIDLPLIPGALQGVVWFFLKLFVFLFMYVWFRATLPRFRYDQLMDLGWKVLIPVAFGWFLFLTTLRLTRDLGWTRSGQVMAGIGAVRGGAGRLRRPAGGATGQRAPAGRRTGRCSDGLPAGLPRHAAADPGAAAASTSPPSTPAGTRRGDHDEKIPKPERLHGRHVLNRYEDGMEKCIGCELCAGVCPAKCIYVRGADNPLGRPRQPRRALRLRLRDQLPALHPLRPVRRGVPDRGHHRVEAVRVLLHQPAGRRLHQGRAGGRRRRASPGSSRGRTGARATTRSRPGGCGPPRLPATPAFEGVAGVVGRAGLRRAGPRTGPGDERTPLIAEPDARRGRRGRARRSIEPTVTTDGGGTTDGAVRLRRRRRDGAGGAFGVILRPNPVHAALSLVLTLFGIAVLFVAQEAHFLAVVQVIVYAGAIVVLFLFVIMLLGVDRTDDIRVEPFRVQRPVAIVIGAGHRRPGRLPRC